MTAKKPSVLNYFQGVNVPFVQMIDGKPIYPESFSNLEWQTLKNSYQVGDFLMPCCRVPAIPKTSINGVKFFAHQSDECATAPESQWHVATKNHLIKMLNIFGATPRLEQSIQGVHARMKSDVYFTWEARSIAIEVQHSYQTLDEYMRRQQRYHAEGIENYWLLYHPRYQTLAKSLGRFRLNRDFGGKFPPNGFFPAISELPIAVFSPDAEGGRITGAAHLNVSLAEWLAAIINKTFICSEGAWKIAY
jgi:hypothetical protein